MRLWSLHPKLLDRKGLIAVWREALLAQKVLTNKSKGYKRHPQLIRFRNHPSPVNAIGNYLHYVWHEANERGYNFKKEKILMRTRVKKIKVTDGQLNYEFKLLRHKLRTRDLRKYSELGSIEQNVIESHPIFRKVKGNIEMWEKSYLKV